MSDHLFVPRSKLNPVAPFGIGTRDVESMTSYICRVAMSHCITGYDLTRKVGRHMDWEINPKFNWRLTNPSGIAGTAERWSRALSELTGVENLNLLTLLPWRGVIAESALMANSSRWCPCCFAEDRATGRTPYLRLAWDIGAVTACATHHTKLTDACPECGHQKARDDSAYIVPGWCTKCGAFLGSGAAQHPVTTEEQWIADQVGNMLARQAILERAPSRDALLDCIRRLIAHLDGGKNALFARRLGVNRSTVHHWVRQGGAPTLPALLCIASHVSLELPKLLTGDLSDWSLTSGASCQRPVLLSPRKARAAAVANRPEQIRAHLAALIESGEHISVSEAARQLNVNPRQLYIVANDEARVLGQRWMRERRKSAVQRQDIARRAIEDAYPKILADGKCVNFRQLWRYIPKEILSGSRGMAALLRDVKRKFEESEPERKNSADERCVPACVPHPDNS